MEEFGPGIDYIKDMKFAPHQDRDLLKKIVELHKTHKWVFDILFTLHIKAMFVIRILIYIENTAVFSVNFKKKFYILKQFFICIESRIFLLKYRLT